MDDDAALDAKEEDEMNGQSTPILSFLCLYCLHETSIEIPSEESCYLCLMCSEEAKKQADLEEQQSKDEARRAQEEQERLQDLQRIELEYRERKYEEKRSVPIILLYSLP